MLIAKLEIIITNAKRNNEEENMSASLNKDLSSNEEYFNTYMIMNHIDMSLKTKRKLWYL